MPSESRFPGVDTVTGKPALEPFRVNWYSKHLAAMNEPVLAPEEKERFRFLYLPTFEAPIAVRVECVAASCDVIAKRLSGKGGYEPGQIAAEQRRLLTAEEIRLFRQAFEAVKFWREQPKEPCPEDTICLPGTDGTRWIFEASKPGAYHVWDIWSPNYTGFVPEYEKLGRLMLRIGNVNESVTAPP